MNCIECGNEKTNWNCKSCISIYNKNNNSKSENKIKKALQDKERYEKNKNNPEFKAKQALKDKKRRSTPKLKAEQALKDKEKYEKNKNNQEFKEKKAISNKKWYEKNKNNTTFKENRSLKGKKHKSTLKYKEKRRQKYICDPNYKLHSLISRLIRTALKGNKNNISILTNLPDSIKIIKNKIEEQFSASHNLDENGNIWMTWENHGNYDPNRKTWHIDHIIPRAALPYTSMEDENFKKCWALSNLQPLEAIENMRKNNKLNWK